MAEPASDETCLSPRSTSCTLPAGRPRKREPRRSNFSTESVAKQWISVGWLLVDAVVESGAAVEEAGGGFGGGFGGVDDLDAARGRRVSKRGRRSG